MGVTLISTDKNTTKGDGMKIGSDRKECKISDVEIIDNTLSDRAKVEDSDRYGVVHNIGDGAELEDMLFAYPITGHFRYFQIK